MKQWGLTIGLVLIFLIGLWVQFYRFTPLESAPARMIKVQIAGAVVEPGVYELEASGRLEQLIEQAGGLLETADERRINLAQKLIDGEKYHIGEMPNVETSEEGHATVTTGRALTYADWLQVPGIGPATAERIVAYLEAHPGAQLSDLIEVSGIGPKKLQDILDHFEKQP